MFKKLHKGKVRDTGINKAAEEILQQMKEMEERLHREAIAMKKVLDRTRQEVMHDLLSIAFLLRLRKLLSCIEVGFKELSEQVSLSFLVQEDSLSACVEDDYPQAVFVEQAPDLTQAADGPP